MNKKCKRLAGLIILGLWAAVTVYFAWLHTFIVQNCYLDEIITLDNRQYIIQEVDAVNFERVFQEDYNYWALNMLYKLPMSLREPFAEIVNFYSRPRIAHNGTWEVNIKGVAIPSLGLNSENPGIYVDGHYSGRAVEQPANSDYSFFNTRGKYYSAEELNQPITLIIEDKTTGSKTETKLVPRWHKKYYFMSPPAQMAEDPEDTARKFFTLASQGRKQEALQLVVPENREGFPWPPTAGIWSQMNSVDDLHHTLERQEKQIDGVVYILRIQGIDGDETLTMDMIKNQDHYEITDII